jgi:hypothetical protein
MAKARARQLPLTKAVNAEVRKQNKLVGNQNDRGKTELAALRESLKGQARHVANRPGARSKVDAVLQQIRKRYGDAELQRAVREFNITFHGIQRDPEEGKNPRHG